MLFGCTYHLSKLLTACRADSDLLWHPPDGFTSRSFANALRTSVLTEHGAPPSCVTLDRTCILASFAFSRRNMGLFSRSVYKIKRFNEIPNAFSSTSFLCQIPATVVKHHINRSWRYSTSFLPCSPWSSHRPVFHHACVLRWDAEER
jgi:hypothetical protein